MNILIYEANSGFTSYTKPLANALAKIGEIDKVSLMTTKNNANLTGIRKEIEVFDCQDTYNTNITNKSMRWIINRISVSLKNILKRNRIIENNKPDVVSIQFTLPVLDQFFWKRIKKYSKVIYTVHDVIPPNKSLFWTRNSLKKLYNQADFLIVHSEENKESLLTEFNVDSEKIRVIHHGIDSVIPHLDRGKSREKLGIGYKEHVVLFYGSIREQKGLDNLICALKGIDCTLIIAGALPFGDSFKKYDSLLKENNIKYIKMVEYISDEMTECVFQACDIVALPYKYFFSQSCVFKQAIQYSK